jgi:transketolase N-terminal domain/subunit/transketolase C-terminal domain/subunit
MIPAAGMQPVIVKLLEIKDVDIRILTLGQARDAVDHGIHIGGAFSAVVPLVTLYYGGILRYDVEHPTAAGQDLFVLSKGHAIAALASIMADLGYFDRSVLRSSRSLASVLNGHPGPLLPGIHTATGPMGQGIAVAEGLALAGRIERRFDVYTITGDGELQEGTAWEAIMYSGDKRLSNLCVIVDNNHGQLDDPERLHIDMQGLALQFRSFGWRALEVDGTSYDSLLGALSAFKTGPRPSQPTAIIANTQKGYGGFSVDMIQHKTELSMPQIALEIEQQERARSLRVEELNALLRVTPDGGNVDDSARSMNLELRRSGGSISVHPIVVPVRLTPAPKRDARVSPAEIAPLDPQASYASDQVISMAMTAYARDPRVVSVDADLSSTSGLRRGVARVDRRRALNVGVAEGNMMCIGEGFAILGYNAWVSTFCPFFNWNVLRRIAVGQQERLEVMADAHGWLTDGHGLDLTFLATAANFETKTNGATHMGNDDLLVFSGMAHLSLIDVSCPNLLLGIVTWIMEGGKGLCYVRVMRSASRVIYPRAVDFSYGKALFPVRSEHPAATIVSSGRGVHEAMKAAALLARDDIAVDVVDMPSIDRQALLDLCGTGKPLVIAEQNNGYIHSQLAMILLSAGGAAGHGRIVPVNTSQPEGRARFIHSGTYEELLSCFQLSPEQLAATVRKSV